MSANDPKRTFWGSSLGCEKESVNTTKICPAFRTLCTCILVFVGPLSRSICNVFGSGRKMETNTRLSEGGKAAQNPDREQAEAVLAAREKSLHQSETRFRELADNISQLAWTADATGSIYWYNKRWHDYAGTTLEEMHGWGWQKVIIPTMSIAS
jgi:PAS domain-containing protein